MVSNKHLVLGLINLVFFFLNMDFFCSLANPSLFIFHSNLGTLILLLYVDDILLTGSFTALVSTFIQLLSSGFVMKDLGQIHHFLGIEISQTFDGLHLFQSHYALTILERANMVDCKPMSAPLKAKTRTSSNNVLLEDPSYFRGLVVTVPNPHETKFFIQCELCITIHACSHCRAFKNGSEDLKIC